MHVAISKSRTHNFKMLFTKFRSVQVNTIRRDAGCRGISCKGNGEQEKCLVEISVGEQPHGVQTDIGEKKEFSLLLVSNLIFVLY